MPLTNSKVGLNSMLTIVVIPHQLRSRFLFCCKTSPTLDDIDFLCVVFGFWIWLMLLLFCACIYASERKLHSWNKVKEIFSSSSHSAGFLLLFSSSISSHSHTHTHGRGLKLFINSHRIDLSVFLGLLCFLFSHFFCMLTPFTCDLNSFSSSQWVITATSLMQFFSPLAGESLENYFFFSFNDSGSWSLLIIRVSLFSRGNALWIEFFIVQLIV